LSTIVVSGLRLVRLRSKEASDFKSLVQTISTTSVRPVASTSKPRMYVDRCRSKIIEAGKAALSSILNKKGSRRKTLKFH